MNFLRKSKGPRKKLSTKARSVFEPSDRPSGPPPPPPSGAAPPPGVHHDVSGESRPVSEPISPDAVAPLVADSQRGTDPRGSRSRFYSDNDSDCPPERRGRFSGPKKRRSSNSSSKFYIPLANPAAGGTNHAEAAVDASTGNVPIMEPHVRRGEKKNSAEQDETPTPPVTDGDQNQHQGEAPSLHEHKDVALKSGSDEKDDETEIVPHPTKRQLPQRPQGGSSVPPSRPPPPAGGFVKKSDSVRGVDSSKEEAGGSGRELRNEEVLMNNVDKRPHDHLLRVNKEDDILTDRRTPDDIENSASPVAGSSSPKVPQRRKHTRRIKTLDCPVVRQFKVIDFRALTPVDSDGMPTDSGASSTDSLDQLLDDSQLHGRTDRPLHDRTDLMDRLLHGRTDRVECDKVDREGNDQLARQTVTQGHNAADTPCLYDKDMKSSTNVINPNECSVASSRTEVTGEHTAKDMPRRILPNTPPTAPKRGAHVLPNTPSTAPKKGVPVLPENPLSTSKPGVHGGHVLSGVVAKPQILRPKPKFNVGRGAITSFTAEDIDICQKKSHDSPSSSDHETGSPVGGATGRLSRKQLSFDRVAGGDRGSKRRSKSVGAPRVAALLAQFSKPAVPRKPKITPPSSSTESLNTPATSVKPSRQLPTTPKPLHPKPIAPKPKLSLYQHRLARPSSSLEDINKNVKQVLRNVNEDVNVCGDRDSRLLVKSTSLDSGLDDEQTSQLDYEADTQNVDAVNSHENIAEKHSKSDKNDHAAVVSHPSLALAESVGSDLIYQNIDETRSLPGTAHSMLPSHNIPVIHTDTSASESIYEDIPDSEICDLPNKTMLSASDQFAKVKQTLKSETKSQKVLRKASRKVSRKESARGFKRKQKSFRNRVYEDVDLKDEIPEGEEEEEVEFSGSDDTYSDDSFTDEDDIQFEQEQAKMLGLSPTKETGDIPPELRKPETPKDKLQQIANELLSTERAYMAKLNIIDQVFHLRLIMENREHHFLPENLIPQIFINIKSIYQFHDFLLKQLEERMLQWESLRKLGDVMMRWAPFLKLYTEYINKFNHAMNTFNSCVEKYQRFSAIVDEIQAMPECGMLTLQHHMLGPIQRVPRYELLLKEYLKHLPEDSLDRDDTQKALDLVAKAAAHANEQIKKNEHSQKLLNLSENIIGASSLNLISPTRELVKEGSITKISARDGSHQDRYLFLFNDCLLVCVPVTLPKMIVKHHYKVKVKLDIEGMRVMEGDDLYTPNTFLIKSKTKSIEFHTSTAEEKDAWQAALWTIIGDFTRKKMSRMTGPNLTEAFEKDELGKRAPTWVKDQAASMCMLCAREFTTFFRRHHCRACGRVVCGLCSARKARLAYEGGKHNRVCDNCYNTLELKLDPDLVRSRGQQRKDMTLRGVKASDSSLVCGHLQMSQDGKHWEKRYFAVRDNFTLYSYKAHQDVFALTSLPLPGYIVHRTKDENQLKGKLAFKLFHIGLKKEYYFQADDRHTLDKWLMVLEKLVRAELPEMEVIGSPAVTPHSTPTRSPSTVPLST